MRLLLLMAAVGSVSLPSVFGADATEVLRRAEVADEHVSYRGMKTATVYFGGKLATSALKVVHMKPDKTRTEYFTPDALSGIIVVRSGDNLFRYHPREKIWEERQHCVDVPSDLMRQVLSRNYDLKLVGRDTVAGRKTYVIHAAPKRGGEAARRIWVDQDFYLVMRTQVEEPNGTVSNSSRYTSIEFNPGNISSCLFQVKGRMRSAPRCGDVEFMPGKPSYLPRGYRIVGVSNMMANGCSCAHMQFSNGSNTISLFEQKACSERPPASVKSKITNVLTWSRDGIKYTLIGDLPISELKKIANSVK